MLGRVEIRRARDGSPRLTGRFPYGRTATMRDRGRVRKERFAPRAFEYAIEDESREINLLVGHDYQRPLASRKMGSLTVEDTSEAVTFEARLPAKAEQPTWMRDALLSVRGGLMAGISPRFTVPPKDVVPDAERLIPEPGNPGVMIREISAAVLLELSLVTRPAYDATSVEARAWREIVEPIAERLPEPRRRVWL